MFKLIDSGLCPIGIDVGIHAVRMVQFRKSRSGLSLQAACRIELASLEGGSTDAGRLASAVRHAFSSQDFSGKKVVLSLPVSCVHTKSVRLPQMPDSDLNQALQWEAKDRFGFEVGENTVGGGQLVWFRAGEVRRGTEIKDELLLFAVEGQVLTLYIEALGELGLQVVGVDLAPCAIERALLRTGGIPGSSGCGAVLDIGHAGSQFFIIRGGSNGSELAFYKHVDIGGRKINEAVADKLGITTLEAQQMRMRLITQAQSSDDAAPLAQALRDAMRPPLEELAKELDMCMRYYVVTFRGSRPETIVLTGRQAACVTVRETLAAALSLQVEEAQALRGVQDLGDAARPDRSGEWAVAAGLSLYPLNVREHAEAAA